MALVLDATVGGANSNSYSTIAEISTAAESVFPVPGWADVDTARRTLCAVEATRVLDLFPFAGGRVDATQALEHPRYPIYDKYGRTVVSTTVVDARVKLAHARLTIFLADQAAGINPFAAAESAGVASIAFGGELSMTFESGATSVTSGERFPRDVIRPILGPLVHAHQPRLVRG